MAEKERSDTSTSSPSISSQFSRSSGLSVLTNFHAGYFRISLSLAGQALLWKTICGLGAAGDSNIAGGGGASSLTRLLPSTALVFLWSLAFATLLILSLLYAARCLLRFPAVRAEFSDHVGVNYLFTPFMSLLLLLQSSPFLHPQSFTYPLLCFVFSIPILALDVKIYGQWFTKGKRFLAQVANPTSQISVIGNLVGARAAAEVGWKESAVCMFALAMAHYVVLFVTLYERLHDADALPAPLRPVFFLFIAAPSMACLAWQSISSDFDLFCKMLFFLSLFLFLSLVLRPALFKKSMKKFNVAWWAYSFPLTLLALAAAEYAEEVKGGFPNALMLVLFALAVVITLLLLTLTALRPHDLLPRYDPFLLSPTRQDSA